MDILFKSVFRSAVLLLAQQCHAANVYENPHDVMTEVIRNGHVQGVMGGAIARKFEQQFRSKGVLLFDANRLYSFKQNGCARIAVDFMKHDIATPKGVTEVTLKTQMNYCLDGRAPQSLELAQ